MARAVFPGSFNPLTVGHLAVADAAFHQLQLDEVCMVISRDPLAKQRDAQSPLDERLDAIRSASASRPWLRADETDHQLLVDIAQGYDFLIVGADKADQLSDPVFYGGSEVERDVALTRLPPLVVAPRPGGSLPENAIVLDLPEWTGDVSSTAVRAGRIEWKA